MSKLVLVRHGESFFNKENKFSGWLDISLSDEGILQAKKTGEILKNYEFDYAFTSKLKRAQETFFEIIKKNKYTNNFIVIHEDDYKYSYNFKDEKGLLKVFETKRLNERFYGDFQNLKKKTIKEKIGEILLKKLRRGYREKILKEKYSYESLFETHRRVVYFFHKRVIPKLKENQNILIVAHGNSLRALVKEIDKLDDDKISKVEIDLAKPLVYDFDKNLEIRNFYFKNSF